MSIWSRNGPDIIARILHGSALQGFRRNIVVGPNEYAVLFKGGQIQPVGMDMVVTEGVYPTLTAGEALGSIVGMGPHRPGALWTNASPHTLEFWLGVDVRDSEQNDPYRVRLITKDGHQVPANITVTVAVDPIQAHRLFNIPELQASNFFRQSDLALKLKNEVISNIVIPEVEEHTLDELRGNTELREDIRDKLGEKIAETLPWYGMRLAGGVFSITWGLTEEELNRMEKRRLEWQAVLNPPEEPEPQSNEEDSNEDSVSAPGGVKWVNTGEIQGSVNVTQNVKISGNNEKIHTFMIIARLAGLLGGAAALGFILMDRFG
ncbi:MAG: hypothetical protein CL787_04800 [Chloroflexi bacterium]|nr:hypothetical protein [Chloroflexota bacterium]